MTSCSARGSEQSPLFHFPCIAYDFTDFYRYCLFSGLKSHNHFVVTQQELSIYFIIPSPTWFSCVADNVISQIRFKLYGQISCLLLGQEEETHGYSKLILGEEGGDGTLLPYCALK